MNEQAITQHMHYVLMLACSFLVAFSPCFRLFVCFSRCFIISLWIENKRHILFTIHMAIGAKKYDKRHEKTHIQLRHKRCAIHKSKWKHSRNEVIIFVFNTLFLWTCVNADVIFLIFSFFFPTFSLTLSVDDVVVVVVGFDLWPVFFFHFYSFLTKLN